MTLFSYSQFLLEARGDVKCAVLMHPNFLKRCREINSDLSRALIEMDRKLSQYTFVKDNPDSDTIQYTEAERALSMVSNIWGKTQDFDAQRTLRFLGIPAPDSPFWNTNRIEIKIGRFIGRFLAGQFTDGEIEDFVNQWKSQKDDAKFQYKTGDEIIRAYDTKNYKEGVGGGSLLNSCMNNKLDFLRLYSQIPHLEIIILVDGQNKILARALLWTDQLGRRFLDRVYYTQDSDYFKFVKLAQREGYYYKKRNISGGSSWILADKEVDLQVKIKLFPGALRAVEDQFGWPKFPFLDTFNYLDGAGEYLTNYQPPGSYYLLNDTDGNYEFYSS